MQELSGTLRVPVVAEESVPLPRHARRARIRGALVTLDAVLLIASGLLATGSRFGYLDARMSFQSDSPASYLTLSAMLAVVCIVFMAMERLYDLDRIFRGSGEFPRIARALSLGFVAFVLGAFLLKVPGVSRLWWFLAWVTAIAFVSAGRFGVRTGLGWLRRHDHLLRPTLLVGSNSESQGLLRVLDADRSTGLRPVGCLASSQAERLSLDFCDGLPCLGDVEDLVRVVREKHIDTVVIASSAFDHEVLARMVAELRNLDVDVHVSSGLFEVLTSRVLVREISGIPLITVKGISLSPMNLAIKRAFDLAFATFGIVAGMPLWLLIAALIKLTSPGPVLYGQERIGRDGVPFRMLKFRSMVADADVKLVHLHSCNEASGPMFKMREDPRVTWIGRWIRRLSLDEFPQLINVFRGDMSLVGPRPPMGVETKQYRENDWRRLDVQPGMTGLWQVSGRSNLTFAEMVRLDLFYIENWSVTLDLSLLVRTLPAVLAARGAY